MSAEAKLLSEVHEMFQSGVREASEATRDLLERFFDALHEGRIRAASRGDDGVWKVHPEVKEGILLSFRTGVIEPMSGPDGDLAFADKDTLPIRRPDFVKLGSRVVPGGSSIRRGAYIGRSVTCMPPMYINVGAWVDDGTMVDSHALVGSCAQIGKRVHLSAAAQIGGVLEPIGMRPVVIEDDVLVGGGVGIYEGTLVRERAVLGAGVSLTASTPVYDLVHERIYRANDTEPLEIPAGAVVVPGARPINGSAWAGELGLQVACAIIVKYRDDKTDLRAALEGDLR